MTTAHRPTWNAAIASNSNPGGNMMVAQTTKINNRDAATFKKMKFRQAGQGLLEDRGSRADLTEDLERREKAAKDEREGRTKEKKRPSLEDNPFPEDADEELPSEDEKEEEAEDEDDDDDDDDAEELMRELAKIKKEREEEEEAKKALQAKQDKRAQRDEVMKGNPLLAEGTDVSLKRRWDDDTVFKNQARTAPKVKQRYINDAVRSDFHKKFLSKYVWVDGVAH
ncbi:cwc-15 [Symbiodinium natans]|uniref:Cwc-15 protein n=1 Tax=Symbiodinium natans TaxID=878477 RepID=A0A812HXU7_9DINO|nr:cwc-15 [Symbiodinium natans]